MKIFTLETEQLREIMDALVERIAEGLAAPDCEIRALPTFLPVPDGNQCGSALVVDTGGTNMRAALVTLTAGNGEINAGPVSAKVPDGRHGPAVEADDFFAAQAQLAHHLNLSGDPLPLGYCFSYPAASQPDGDAVLLRWTKGINVNGVVGGPVGKPLTEALKKEGLVVEGLSVLNDTVASLLGGAHLYADARFGHNYIGLILGTGTNMAGVFTPQQLGKVNCNYPMVVNLESGNFRPPHLTEYDEAVDQAVGSPGSQRFEKAVSGHYLPYVFQAARPGVFDPDEGTGRLVELRDEGGEHAEVAGAILHRSARLAAAGVAALATFYPADNDTAILGEGTLLWGDPQYAGTLQDTLKELLPERRIELVRQRENVNLLGAASAALYCRSLVER